MATNTEDSAALALPVGLPPTPPLSTSDPNDTHTSNDSQDGSEAIRSQTAASTPPSKHEFHESQHPSTPTLESPQPSLTSSISKGLSQPREWLNMYSSFVTKNASSVASIESALRSLTYVIPGRFRDAEIASESLHSSIQLLSLYHDTLLARAVAKLPGMPKIQTPHMRYTKFWTAKSGVYRKVAVLLQCTQYTELLWEMAAKRRGERVRWRVVVIIEVIKAICRLLLLRITAGRMVVPPLPEREAIPGEPEEEDDGLAYGDEEEEVGKPQKEWAMPRTGLTLPALPSPRDISGFLMKKVLTADDIKPAINLISRIQGPAQIAEILHILRPVIYAVAMARTKNKKSWQPWLLGIAVELAARQLRQERGRDGVRETALEKEEWTRRGWAMGWWGLRGAFYENVTKKWVDGLVGSRFMPGLVGGILQDYAFLWDEYHFASDDM
jgi:peroxin-16